MQELIQDVVVPTCMPEVPFSILGTDTTVVIESNRGSRCSFQTV